MIPEGDQILEINPEILARIQAVSDRLSSSLRTHTQFNLRADSGFYSSLRHRIYVNPELGDAEGAIVYFHESVHLLLGESLYYYAISDLRALSTLLKHLVTARRGVVFERTLQEIGLPIDKEPERALAALQENALLFSAVLSRNDDFCRAARALCHVFGRLMRLLANTDVVQEGAATYYTHYRVLNEPDWLRDYMSALGGDADGLCREVVERVRREQLHLESGALPFRYRLGVYLAECIAQKWGVENVLDLAGVALAVPLYRVPLLEVSNSDFEAFTNCTLLNPNRRWIALAQMPPAQVALCRKAWVAGESIHEVLHRYFVQQSCLPPSLQRMRAPGVIPPDDQFRSTLVNFSRNQIIANRFLWQYTGLAVPEEIEWGGGPEPATGEAEIAPEELRLEEELEDADVRRVANTMAWVGALRQERWTLPDSNVGVIVLGEVGPILELDSRLRTVPDCAVFYRGPGSRPDASPNVAELAQLFVSVVGTLGSAKVLLELVKRHYGKQLDVQLKNGETEVHVKLHDVTSKELDSFVSSFRSALSEYHRSLSVPELQAHPAREPLPEGESRQSLAEERRLSGGEVNTRESPPQEPA